MIKNINTCYTDDIQNHLMRTYYQHIDNTNEVAGILFVTLINAYILIFLKQHLIIYRCTIRKPIHYFISIPDHTETLHTYIHNMP